MKTLITAIKTELQGAAISGLRAGDVYISPTVNYMPETIQALGIGIVPGPESRVEKLGGMFEVTRIVRIALFSSMLKPDASVIGDARNPGILDAAKSVDDVLHGNFLGLSAIESAFCRLISEPVVFGAKEQYGRFIVRVVMDYQYESEEESP